MHIFYDPNIRPDAEQHILSEEESAHACRVLRLKAGDTIELLNGKGDSFNAEITEAHPKKCSLKILTCISHQKQNCDIHIAIAPTKNMERLEWFAEKTTELGITHITLLLCKNNERKVVKTDRLEKILISAMKQSKRKFLPILSELTSFKDFIKENPKGLIAHCYDGEKQGIKDGWNKTNSPILIGPEGDFSLEEVQLALQSGYKAIHLGENRLRTETAGLYACMQALQSAEDLNK